MASCRIPNCAGNGKLVKVSLKGYNTLVNKSKERGDNNAFSLPMPELQVFVHESCRKKYVSEKSVKADKRRQSEKTVSKFIHFLFLLSARRRTLMINFLS